MDQNQSRTLGWHDYLVVGGMLACSISIGLYHAYRGKKKNQGTEGYLLGNRSLNFLPVAVSITVNFKSAVTIIGMPADVYQFGIVYAWCLPALLLITGPIVGYVILPVLYNLKISSAYEYMEKRYGRPMRLIATSAFVLQTLLFMGLNVYGPSLALSRATGFPQAASMLTTGFVCVIYTTLGGLRGVIWSDVFQAAIMTTALLSFLIRGTVVAGGVEAVWDHMVEGGRGNLASFDLDPRIRYSFWTCFFGSIVIWVGMFGTMHTNIQRYLSVKSVKKARWAMFIGITGVAIIASIAIACGVVLHALFHNCDPIESGCIKTRDELMPYAVMDIFKSFPGMRGLFLAGVFSASLSTISSGLNAMVSVVIADYLKPYTRWTDSRYEITSKVLTACLGLVIIGTGFLASVLGEILIVAIGIVGSFYGAYIGIFLMGIWMPFVNSWGAAFGFLFGVMGSFVAFLGGRGFIKPQYLVRKLPVSTQLCPAHCGYMDSMNMTAAYETSTNLAPSTSLDYYSLSTLEEHDMSFIQNIFSLSVFYTPTIGLIYSVLVGIIVSLVTGKRNCRIVKLIFYHRLCVNLGGWTNRHLVDEATIDPISITRLTQCLPSKLKDLCHTRNANDNFSENDDERNDRNMKGAEDLVPLSTLN